jgi:hypothetical protein
MPLDICISIETQCASDALDENKSSVISRKTNGMFSFNRECISREEKIDLKSYLALYLSKKKNERDSLKLKID